MKTVAVSHTVFEGLERSVINLFNGHISFREDMITNIDEAGAMVTFDMYEQIYAELMEVDPDINKALVHLITSRA